MFKGFELDKDYYGSNCYSKETCVWLTKKDNQIYNRCRPFILYKDKDKLGIYLSAKQAAHNYEFDSSCLIRVLSGKLKHIKGFTARYIEDNDWLYRYELKEK